ncbi:hypothetical protein MBAV_004491 [Candidatus Magnetobacterium bavaricum]|uniref:Uncharacterized protein n=1 Tax=Candidatus Magnetobacterium bavaricum TaxID=29290 RepID=A0A0F3GN15_9BACT|nr:hypothetical protein MBAV_004491 [Candidatus Magnetobacterium bavaricum]
MGFVYFTAGFGLYLLLHGQQFDFAVEHFADLSEAFHGVIYLKDVLSLVRLEADVGGHKVGKASGVVEVLYHDHNIGQDALAQ